MRSGTTVAQILARGLVLARRVAPEAVGGLGFSVLAFLLFWHQNQWDIVDWDEARHIVSGYEMLRSGDWIINTWMGQPDLWNLKPPISFWAIAGSMHLFGFTPLGMRLPSLLATLGTALVCYRFARRRAGRWSGAFTLLAFASCAPLINAHTGRTADADAIYILAITISVLASIEAFSNPRWLLLSTTAFSMAFLTKSWHASLSLLLAAAVTAILLIRKRTTWRPVLVSAAGFLPLIAWGICRYLADGPRFLVGMVQYDLIARSATPLDSHAFGKTYYLDGLQGSFGLWLLAGGLGLGLHLAVARVGASRSDAERRTSTALIVLACWSVLIFAAFSSAATKLYWYTAPAYPALVLLAGMGVGLGLRAANGKPVVKVAVVLVAAAAFGLGAQDLRWSIASTVAVPQQELLVDLAAKDPKSAVFVDGSAGGWTQSMVAVAETRGLQPITVPPSTQTAGHVLYAVTMTDQIPPRLLSGGRVGTQIDALGGYHVFRIAAQ